MNKNFCNGYKTHVLKETCVRMKKLFDFYFFKIIEWLIFCPSDS